MTTEFVIFTGEDCAPCRAQKSWMMDNNIKFTEFDRSSSKAAMMRVRSVPTTVKMVDGSPADMMFSFNLTDAKRFFGVR